ncbi:MAG: hypothetical protein WC070_03825 [Candidatus Magasanikbacteria bacterium]
MIESRGINPDMLGIPKIEKGQRKWWEVFNEEERNTIKEMFSFLKKIYPAKIGLSEDSSFALTRLTGFPDVSEKQQKMIFEELEEQGILIKGGRNKNMSGGYIYEVDRDKYNELLAEMSGLDKKRKLEGVEYDADITYLVLYAAHRGGHFERKYRLRYWSKSLSELFGFDISPKAVSQLYRKLATLGYMESVKKRDSMYREYENLVITKKGADFLGIPYYPA